MSDFFYGYYFWLCWVFVALLRLFSCWASGGCSLVVLCRLCHCGGLSWFGGQAVGFQASVLSARSVGSGSALVQWFRCTDLVTSRLVESAWTRGQTRVPCIGRWILIHCTTKEVHNFLKFFFFFFEWRNYWTNMCKHYFKVIFRD